MFWDVVLSPMHLYGARTAASTTVLAGVHGANQRVAPLPIMTLNDFLTTFLAAISPASHGSKRMHPLWLSSSLALLTIAAIEFGAWREPGDATMAPTRTPAHFLKSVSEWMQWVVVLTGQALTRSGLLEGEASQSWFCHGVWRSGAIGLFTAVSRAISVSPQLQCFSLSCVNFFLARLQSL